MLDVTIHADRVQIGRHFSVSFERTLRIPDDGRDYPLPPSVGQFPVRRVADYADRVPRPGASTAACSCRCTSARRCG